MKITSLPGGWQIGGAELELSAVRLEREWDTFTAMIQVAICPGIGRECMLCPVHDVPCKNR